MKPLDVLFAKQDRLFKAPAYDAARLPPGFTPPKGLVALWQRGNGGYFWGGLLHVFGACAQPMFHSIQAWNDAEGWRGPYGAAADGLVFFAETAFGNQFAFDEKGAVWLFIASEGVAKQCAENFDQWLEAVLDDEVQEAFEFRRDQYARFSTQFRKKLEHGNHIQAYPPLDFVEDPAQSELSEVDAFDNMLFLADLARAIADLPEGVRLVFGADGIEQVPVDPPVAQA